MSENSAVRPLLYWDPKHVGHRPPEGIPERPERVELCIQYLKESEADYEEVSVEAASVDVLSRVHERAYLDALDRACRAGGGQVDVNTFLSPDSFQVAARAAGSCCEAAGHALESDRRSLCLVRPPGHHASSDEPMGYCIINNAAVGAAHALALGADKVAIVDIDVHHGNGTQSIFWSDPRVLFVSIHQWPWYPYSTGGAEEVGGPGAEGTNLNLPMAAGSGDAEYVSMVETAIAPALREFGPSLLIVSCGFDAHRDEDPALGLQEVTGTGYQSIVSRLAALATSIGAGFFVVLEGGYAPKALSAVSNVLIGMASGGYHVEPDSP